MNEKQGFMRQIHKEADDKDRRTSEWYFGDEKFQL